MHLKGIPAGWQGSSAHVRVKHTYGLTLRSVIQIEALRDCRCCKNVHFYISCCMERLWSCGWKGWGTGSFEALGNAVLACLVHAITFLCLAKNSHISLKSEATRKQAPQKKKENKRKQHGIVERFGGVHMHWICDPVRFVQMKTWTYMQFPFIGQEALCPENTIYHHTWRWLCLKST